MKTLCLIFLLASSCVKQEIENTTTREPANHPVYQRVFYTGLATINRFENHEVICYDIDQSGLSCKFKY